TIGRSSPAAGVGIPLWRHRRWLGVMGAGGQPRDGIPAASYALFDLERSTLTYVRVPYDVAGAAAKVRAAGLPSILALRLEQGYFASNRDIRCRGCPTPPTGTGDRRLPAGPARMRERAQTFSHCARRVRGRA